MTVSERLRQAKTLAVEHNVQGCFAADIYGRQCSARDCAAVSFCAYGACMATNAPFGYLYDAGEKVSQREALASPGVERWDAGVLVNDVYPQFLAEMFDMAIAAAEADEAVQA